MKKISTIFLLLLGIQLSNAHPSLTGHSHDSALGTYGWIILPIIFILAIGIYYSTSKKTRSLR